MTNRVGPILVMDSSALVALLTDDGDVGIWVAETIAGATLAAPQLAPFEVANILRREQLHGAIDPTTTTLAHQDLLELPLQLWPYTTFAERAWQLRENVTAYDSAYIALAELLAASVITLDNRLARAPNIRCTIRLPGDH